MQGYNPALILIVRHRENSSDGQASAMITRFQDTNVDVEHITKDKISFCQCKNKALA